MKLILSRKGLDSSFGGFPSPILPDGSICWLPIPESSETKPNLPTYADINFRGRSLGDIVSELSKGKMSPRQTVHLDPDLNPSHLARSPGWKPMFGQTGAAERHLMNNSIGPGDLFLFFGWFRMTEFAGGRLRYAVHAPDLHVIYGWLQISERIPVGDLFFPWSDWMDVHPHIQGKPYSDLDVVYLASHELNDFPGATSLPGVGLFSTYDERLTLTAPNCSRSQWKLPADFFPSGRPPLTYHNDEERWTKDTDGTYLRSASRGQEFILDLDHYPGVVTWLVDSVFGRALETRGMEG